MSSLAARCSELPCQRAETYAWHVPEMQEINSLLCKYMRAKTVENGRVRQWQRLHEHWRIPPVSVEVAVSRVGWLQAMLRDETNHAHPLAAIFVRFLRKEVLEEKGGLCEGANPFAVAFHRDGVLVCWSHGHRGALRGSSEGWVPVAIRGTV